MALNIHRVTESLPKKHNGALISQIRRAAVSIPTNIAEDSSRATDLDFTKFVRIAIGSASELEYPLQFAADSNMLPREEFEARHLEVVDIRRMLIGLLKKLRAAPR